jgi:3-hydroxyisobutyrate dehydrogenase-like beta-hydroxyacid dehydrogenase
MIPKAEKKRCAWPDDLNRLITFSRTYGSMIASDKFEPAGFKLPLGLKDNRLLLAAAEEAAVPMPMASLVHDRFVAALAQGLGEADWAAIARISYQNAGLKGVTK